MAIWELLLVGAVMLLGLCGLLIPGVPGAWLVWGAVSWWALQDRSAPAWWVLVGATSILLLQQAVRLRMPPRRFRGIGLTRRTVVWAGLGALIGFFLVPVVGAIPGFIGGIYGAERLRLGGHRAATASTRRMMRAAGANVLVELFACLLILGAWLGVMIWA